MDFVQQLECAAVPKVSRGSARNTKLMWQHAKMFVSAAPWAIRRQISMAPLNWKYRL